MTRKLLALASLLAAAAGATAQAAPVTINFDGAVQTNITNAYVGLTFLSASGTGVARTWAAPFADTPGNVVGLTSTQLLSQTDSAAIDIVFDTAVSFVSIRAMFLVGVELYTPFGTALPFMSAYNSTTISAANRLGLDTWNIAGDPCLTSNTMCLSGWDTLEFSSLNADIRAIRISGFAYSGTPRRAIFDTLTYDRAGGGGGGGTVAEPSSPMLAGLAGAGLLVSRRRRQPAPAV
ncbi:MAG: hypothetical protein LH480_07555 [Rubrivivax sp.]|nr:hypothetical protein [Rubrivivax sp.]